MAQKDREESIDDELERARDRLQQLNLKAKEYATRYSRDDRPSESLSLRSSRRTPEDVSLQEIHKKLQVINNYFRDRIGKEVSPPSVEAVEEDTFKEASALEEKSTEESVQTEKPATSKFLPRVKPSRKKASVRLGVGLDVGTSSLVASREVEEHRVFSRSERNAFLAVRNDSVTRDLLTRIGVKYVATGGQLYVLGNMALELSNIFNREMQRSMRVGVLNPSEAESIPIVKLLVQNILWSPREDGEVCCFSMPAPMIDIEQDSIYHRGVFEKILNDIGFKGVVVDEGYAVVLSELADRDFTGIGVSCGGGLVNVCAAFKSVPVSSFSITRGGDWIDKNAASALGIAASNVTAIKERGVSLTKPTSREEEAIAIYYRSFIRYFLEHMAHVFGEHSKAPRFTKPLDIVFAGGSSLAGDFLDAVKEELKVVDLGIPLGRIRRAEEPLISVASGCLFHAITSGQ